MKSVHLLLYYLDDTQLCDKLVCFLNFILSGFVGVTCTESAMLNVTEVRLSHPHSSTSIYPLRKFCIEFISFFAFLFVILSRLVNNFICPA